MDHSFHGAGADLEDISFADLSIADMDVHEDPTSCSCKGSCWYKTGKNCCPCRSSGANCTSACTCGKKRLCANKPPVESSSNSESTDEDTGPPTKSRRKSATKGSERQRITAPVQPTQDRETEEIRTFVSSLDRGQLDNVIIKLLTRFPEVYMDALALAQPEPPAPPAQPANAQPPWCRCRNCLPMPTDIENVCCKQRMCVTSTQNFVDSVLNGNVIVAAMAANRDNFPRDIPRDNASYRHYAYKQWTYIHHGYLGAGNRKVAPSCVVLRIRRGYPAPTNRYKGYVDGIHD